MDVGVGDCERTEIRTLCIKEGVLRGRERERERERESERERERNK
jgi:hypothetical protein